MKLFFRIIFYSQKIVEIQSNVFDDVSLDNEKTLGVDELDQVLSTPTIRLYRIMNNRKKGQQIFYFLPNNVCSWYAPKMKACEEWHHILRYK